MLRRQPLADVGRHQKRLLAIAGDEALSHPGRLLNSPDRTRLTRQPQAKAVASRTVGVPAPLLAAGIEGRSAVPARRIARALSSSVYQLPDCQPAPRAEA